ncbi:MAG: hypothetical protein HMLKMBBP_01037 [Planctomycetes bacterium]|nr:hypothetical protein [Planctomycetota bacterium]
MTDPGRGAPPALPARRVRLFRMILGVGLPALVLGGAEFVLRRRADAKGLYIGEAEAAHIASGSYFEPHGDPEILWINRRGQAWDPERRIDEHGLVRVRPITEAKPPGTVRVAVVGDSVGAAPYLAEDDRLSTQLEFRLAAALGKPVEAPNFCVNGYDAIQAARTVERRVPAFAPDAVLFVLCLNDTTVSRHPYTWFRPVAPPASHVLRAVTDGLGITVDGVDGRPWTPRGSPSEPGSASAWRAAWAADGAGVASVGAALDRMRAWSDASKVPVVVAVAPLVLADADTEGRAAGRAFADRASEMIRARGLRLVRLDRVADEIPFADLRIQATGDIFHVSARGARLAAEILAPELVSAVR